MTTVTSKIPPQAYTRDTLVKAIEWISHQPASVRERANSADAIVSHYLQARRQSSAQAEMPLLSQESFKSDLKTLADDLQVQDDPVAPPSRASYLMEQQEFPEPTLIPRRPLRQEPKLKIEPKPMMPEAPAPVAAPTPPVPVKSSYTWLVDDRSLAAAKELQERFNLSNEGEALRALVTLGAERFRNG